MTTELYASPWAVAERLKTFSTEKERQQYMDAFPSEKIRERIKIDETNAGDKEVTDTYRAQFMEHLPDWFKPNLAGDEKLKEYVPLFKDKLSISKIFKERVLDVVDYDVGIRRAPLAEEASRIAVNSHLRPFPKYCLATDIPIASNYLFGKYDTYKDGDEKAQKFIDTIKRLLYPCPYEFEIVHDPHDHIYVRTNIDEQGFSMLGNIIVFASKLELTEDEKEQRMREGQARLWKNPEARKIGRLVYPGACEMAALAVPGISFRPLMGFNEKHELVPQLDNDPVYVDARKHTPERPFVPDLFYRPDGKKPEQVLKFVLHQTIDYRVTHDATLRGRVGEKIKRGFRSLRTIEGAGGSVLKAMAAVGEPIHGVAEIALEGVGLAAEKREKSGIARESNEKFVEELKKMQKEAEKSGEEAQREAQEDGERKIKTREGLEGFRVSLESRTRSAVRSRL